MSHHEKNVRPQIFKIWINSLKVSNFIWIWPKIGPELDEKSAIKTVSRRSSSVYWPNAFNADRALHHNEQDYTTGSAYKGSIISMEPRLSLIIGSLLGSCSSFHKFGRSEFVIYSDLFFFPLMKPYFTFHFISTLFDPF